MTSGSSASICWVRMGVAESAEGCGRGAKGAAAPKVGWGTGGLATCSVSSSVARPR